MGRRGWYTVRHQCHHHRQGEKDSEGVADPFSGLRRKNEHKQAEGDQEYAREEHVEEIVGVFAGEVDGELSGRTRQVKEGAHVRGCA